MSSQRPPEPVATPSQTSGTQLDWTLFVLLSFMWGSSYLFIKIGVDEGLQPLTLIMLRLLFGTLLLISVFLVVRPALPTSRRTYGHLLVMALFSIVIPFWLITYGEGSGVDSSVASILNSTVPLFTIVIAPLFLHDESITVNRLAGLAVGFAGVVILTSGDLGGSGAAGGISPGIVALLLSAVSYAVGAVYARRNARGLSPMTIALFQVLFAFTITTTLAFAIENPLTASITPAAAFSVVWLGLFGSGLAYLLFFRLLGDWGPTRTSLVAYLLPVWGILLGVAVLQETVDARVLFGTALIIGGVALVNARFGGRQLFRRSAPAADRTPPDRRNAGRLPAAQASSASSTAPATITAEATIRRVASPRVTASPIRTAPHAAATTVADSRSGATAVNGATLSAYSTSRYATSVRIPPTAAGRTTCGSRQPVPRPAATTPMARMSDPLSQISAAYGTGSISRVPTRSTVV